MSRMRIEAKDSSAVLTNPGNFTAAQPKDAKEKTPYPEDGHAVARDQNARDSVGQPTILEFLRHAQKKSGRAPMDMARDFFRLNRGPGKLSWPEYIQYGVYDTTRLSAEDQSKFISLNLHWPITHVCCDMTWQATTEDKWLCAYILTRAPIEIPETLAVIDKSERAYPGTTKIATAGALREFMTSQDALPLFGKENRGICSFGAFLVEDANDKAMLLKGQGWLDYDACMEKFLGETPYILQPLERNHSFFDRYTSNLATVRLCILLREDGVRIPFAVLKLPSNDNVADSFWRPGNLACNLDVQTGKVLTIRSKDALGTTDHATHPETGAPLLGETLPMWDRVLELAKTCAPIFGPVRYQSMDIAIRQDGPVLIEINTGGGFDLPQYASGEGFLTDEVRDFFRSCGYEKV